VTLDGELHIGRAPPLRGHQQLLCLLILDLTSLNLFLLLKVRLIMHVALPELF
jgi:hypothetical protein